MPLPLRLLFLNVPIEELKRRDSKGIYSKFAKGELINVAGLDLPVDLPFGPDFTLQIVSGDQKQGQENELFAKLSAFFSTKGADH